MVIEIKCTDCIKGEKVLGCRLLQDEDCCWPAQLLAQQTRVQEPVKHCCQRRAGSVSLPWPVPWPLSLFIYSSCRTSWVKHVLLVLLQTYLTDLMPRFAEMVGNPSPPD